MQDHNETDAREVSPPPIEESHFSANREEIAASEASQIISAFTGEVHEPSRPTTTNAISDTLSSPAPLESEQQNVPNLMHDRIGPTFMIDPTLCVPYLGSPRAGVVYDEARDFELRQDILAHGVVEPIVVAEREITYPILSGNRRHAVVSQLLSEGMAISLPARVARLSEKEAFAFAAAQNVGRLAPTPMEQARSIAWTLEFVEPSQARIAEALGIAESKVSRLALLATLPDWVLTIVTDPETLSENFAGQLQRGLGAPATAKTMQKRSDRLVAMGRTLPGPAAARYLTTGTLDAAANDLVDRQGVRHATAREDRNGGFTVRIPPGFRRPNMDIAAVHTLISDWLLDLMKNSAAKSR